MNTRRSTTIFGVGAGLTKEDEEITGCRLPTNEQVIRCYKFHQQKGSTQGTASNRIKRDNAKIVLDKIILFCLKGNNPMITKTSACEKILELVAKNSKLCEIPIKRHPSQVKEM